MKRRVIGARTVQPRQQGTHIKPPPSKYMVKNEVKVGTTNSVTTTRSNVGSTTRTAKPKPAPKLRVTARRPRQTPMPAVAPPPPTKFAFSGMVIYDGRFPLNPYKWTPDMPENLPDHLKWDNLAPGTQVLDKNTHLNWIVLEGKKLGLAPCQTIKVDMKAPKNLASFTPHQCINPFLPDIHQIPVGTLFIFKNTSQCFRLNHHLHLEETTSGNLRPAQLIPIAINSLYNTQQLIGLDVPIVGSSLQRPTREGYHTLEEWLSGIIEGSETRPGYLGDLPKVGELQPFDVLDFYDPNITRNPQQHGLNPDGSLYIDGFHESEYFQYRMQVVFDDSQNLSAKEIMAPPQAMLSQVLIPADETDQQSVIYLRSVALVPRQGEPIVLVNSLDQPYYLPKDANRLQNDLRKSLVRLGYPYEQIKVGYLGREGEFFHFRFAGLPDHVWGIVFSSDLQPYNKYNGSGRFYLGYSGQSTGELYRCTMKTRLEDIVIDEIYVDGIRLEMAEDGYLFESNQKVNEWLQNVNLRLPEVGYPGYVLSLWWSELPDRLYLYLGGASDQLLPEIMFKTGEELIPLDFERVIL